MKRLILFASLLAATGCASSSARFVERRADGGVVAVSDYKHRDDALDLIDDEVGPASILHEEEVVTGSDVKTRTEVGNGNVLQRIGAWFTGTEHVATTDTQTVKATEWRITYTTRRPPP